MSKRRFEGGWHGENREGPGRRFGPLDRREEKLREELLNRERGQDWRGQRDYQGQRGFRGDNLNKRQAIDARGFGQGFQMDQGGGNRNVYDRLGNQEINARGQGREDNRGIYKSEDICRCFEYRLVQCASNLRMVG